MTTMLSARDGLAAYLQTLMAAKSDWYVDWDNVGVPDVDGLTKFLCIDIDFVGGRQADLNPLPTHRRFGFVKFHVAVKEFTGVRDQISLMDYLADNTQTRALAGCTMKAASMQPSVTQHGWDVREVWIPFEVDNR